MLFVATANQLDTSRAAAGPHGDHPPGRLHPRRKDGDRPPLPDPQGACENHGLQKGQVVIRKEALHAIIDGYAREAGVRSLENRIKKIMRHAAMEFSQGHAEKITVSKKDVATILGKPVFTEDEVFEDVPGVVTGLAWTSMGGATLQIEATAMPSKSKGFKQTGQLGKVMVESSEIAYSYVMAHLEDYGIDPEFFRQALRSLACTGRRHTQRRPVGRCHHGNRTAVHDYRQTGDQKTWHDRGADPDRQGIAHRWCQGKDPCRKTYRITTVILPEANRKDFEELPDHLQANLSVYFARDYQDVYRVALG